MAFNRLSLLRAINNPKPTLSNFFQQLVSTNYVADTLFSDRELSFRFHGHTQNSSSAFLKVDLNRLCLLTCEQGFNSFPQLRISRGGLFNEGGSGLLCRLFQRFEENFALTVHLTEFQHVAGITSGGTEWIPPRFLTFLRFWTRRVLLSNLPP